MGTANEMGTVRFYCGADTHRPLYIGGWINVGPVCVHPVVVAVVIVALVI